MNNFNNVSELELAEAYAADNAHYPCYNLVTDEDDLSERFDEILDENLKLKETLRNDKIMLNEEFSYFADRLCKDGLLHSSQYNEYCYVGELLGDE